MNIMELIERAEAGDTLEVEQIARLLAVASGAERDALVEAAYRVKRREVGTVVYFRGIVEFSNQCVKDCSYCGIRRSMRDVERFCMSAEEIVESALWAFDRGYGSIVLQSGERSDTAFAEFVEGVVRDISARTGGELGVTLSLGEQSGETYARWKAAGAHRYLLRIETSDADLYARLHPADHRFDERLACLGLLREGGWQVGTGVMIGLPGQTTDHLARDIGFFRDQDVDMVGMGPYIPHAGTPLAEAFGPWHDAAKARQLDLGLRMIAVARLVLRDVNIAATTALQALDDAGREQGLMCGANIIMPNLTQTRYRRRYQLYDGKPCLDENAAMCRGCLERRIERIGETIAYGRKGDPPHYTRRRDAVGGAA